MKQLLTLAIFMVLASKAFAQSRLTCFLVEGASCSRRILTANIDAATGNISDMSIDVTSPAFKNFQGRGYNYGGGSAKWNLFVRSKWITESHLYSDAQDIFPSEIRTRKIDGRLSQSDEKEITHLDYLFEAGIKSTAEVIGFNDKIDASKKEYTAIHGRLLLPYPLTASNFSSATYAERTLINWSPSPAEIAALPAPLISNAILALAWNPFPERPEESRTQTRFLLKCDVN